MISTNKNYKTEKKENTLPNAIQYQERKCQKNIYEQFHLKHIYPTSKAQLIEFGEYYEKQYQGYHQLLKTMRYLIENPKDNVQLENPGCIQYIMYRLQKIIFGERF